MYFSNNALTIFTTDSALMIYAFLRDALRFQYLNGKILQEPLQENLLFLYIIHEGNFLKPAESSPDYFLHLTILL
jgi:hypothetical protein